MPNLYDYRIFISHAWKYGSAYDSLVTLLNNAPYFSYYNYSAPKEKTAFPIWHTIYVLRYRSKNY